MNHSQFIQPVLQEAAKIATEKFGKVVGNTKAEDNNQVFTEADLMIGQHITSRIQAEFPSHNIIDEEAGAVDNQSNYTWVVDPIDGTSNFAQGIPQYGIYLGLLDSGQPIAGGIALPYFNETYIAEKGGGAFCNGQPVRVTDETRLLSALVAYQIDGNQDKPDLTRDETKILAEIILNIRNLRDSGSCFDYAMVVKGKYGAVLNRTSKIWDNVAAQIIIEEAGGIYTDFFGRSLDYSNPLTKLEQNYTACAGAPIWHSQLQEIIQRFPQ